MVRRATPIDRKGDVQDGGEASRSGSEERGWEYKELARTNVPYVNNLASCFWHTSVIPCNGRVSMSENWTEIIRIQKQPAGCIRGGNEQYGRYDVEKWRSGVSSNAYRVIAAPDCDTESGGMNETPVRNAPVSDSKRWIAALGWYRSRPSGWCRSYTAPAPKLDLPFVGLEVAEAR
jgi:hypothetical protein